MSDRKKLKALGEHLKKVRKRKKITPAALARLIGKDRQSIYKVERGDFNPTYLYLSELAEGLKTTVKRLVDFDPESKKDGAAKKP